MRWERTTRGWATDAGRNGWLEVVPDNGCWRALMANYGVETVLPGEYESDVEAKAGALHYAKQAATDWENCIHVPARQADEE